MKKRIVTFIIASLFGISSAGADTTYSQKTFLMPRAAGVNLAMEDTIWHDHVYTLHRKNTKIKSHFQVTPFFQESTNRNDIGKYFGVGNGSNSFTVGTTAGTSTALVLTTPGTANIDGSYLIHSFNNTLSGNIDQSLQGTVTFKPYQQLYGTRLDYVQMMGSPFNNLFFKASMPIVHVENNMAMNITNSTPVNIGGQNFSLADFFAGNVNVTTAGSDNLQSPLTNAKINGRRTAFGIADLDIAIGYVAEQTPKRYFAFNVGLTIPTGNRVRGEYLFEPIYGNGHHVGLGGNVDTGFELWKGEHGQVWVSMGASYRYLFTATESRTLNVTNLNPDSNFLTYYQLAGINAGPSGQQLFPLANVLTRALRVKPGSQFDSSLDISFKSKQYIIDVGYNMYWKDQETIHLKGTFDPSIYGIAGNNASTNPKFTPLAQVTANALDLEAMKTPSQLTYKIFGGFGYRFNISHDYPTSISLGGSYEFTQDNAALEQYAIWLKTAFSF